MTAFHTIILFSDGAPLTPAGGSSCSLYNKNKKERNVKAETSSILVEWEIIFIRPGNSQMNPINVHRFPLLTAKVKIHLLLCSHLS